VSDWRSEYATVVQMADRRAKRSAASAETSGDTPQGPLIIDQSGWSETDIKRRPWIAPGYVLRGSVTILGGAGAAGKSMLACGWAVAAASGRQWSRFAPVQACRVSIYNAEDDLEEQRRRFSAVLRQFELTPDWCAGRIARIEPTETAYLYELDPLGIVETLAMKALDEHIAVFRPDILFVDPMVEMHSAEENNNTALRMVLARLRILAKKYNMAIVVIAHTRKGPASPGDAQSIRGAGDIVGASRSSFTVCVMTPEEAERLNIAEELRWRFFRVDGAKSNYAALTLAEWFERVEYELDNNESVAAAVPWTPPSAAITLDILASAESLVAKGAPTGSPWSPKLDGGQRSFASALRNIGVVAFPDQKRVLDQLLANGVSTARFKTPRRSAAQLPVGLRTSAGLPANVEWVN